jgi:hypothetical protein
MTNKILSLTALVFATGCFPELFVPPGVPEDTRPAYHYEPSTSVPKKPAKKASRRGGLTAQEQNFLAHSGEDEGDWNDRGPVRRYGGHVNYNQVETVCAVAATPGAAVAVCAAK